MNKTAAMREWMRRNQLDIGLAWDVLRLFAACVAIGWLLRGLR